MRVSQIVKGSYLILMALVGLASSGGSPGGRTGSPTDMGTCGAQNCHGEQTPVHFDLISTNIPVDGYLPSHTYTININASRAGIDKYGFELVAENAGGAAVGKFTGNAEVTSYISNRRATHKSTSNTGMGGRSWSVEWHAPSAGTGTITFYAACLAANGNGNNFGDSVLIDQFEVAENTTAHQSELAQAHLKIYPNPCADYLLIHGFNGDHASIEIYTVWGQLIANKEFQKKVNLTNLKAGNYFLVLRNENVSRLIRFIKR